jgi:hypothetical protein
MDEQIAKVDYWQEVLTKFEDWEGSIVDFCKENQVNIHRLYYYRKKAKQQNSKTFHRINLPNNNAATTLINKETAAIVRTTPKFKLITKQNHY